MIISTSIKLILTSLEGVVTKYPLLFKFKASNNEAKYEALTVRLKIAKKLGVRYLRVYSDS